MTNCSRADAGAWFNYPFLTSKERDIETGLDYFLARYYSSGQGRFTSPDPLIFSGKVGVPQSWNQGQSQVQTQAETFGRSLFAAQVNDASLSNTQYVTNLYEAFLQRGPDAGGLGFWSGQASVGQGRQNVLDQFATCGAFRELAGTLYREANWLVADQLGTPRMIVNKSGTLASVKRHDYLPFGEEIFAGTGGRTTTPQGYSGDSVRQKFTQKERDNETGLDYFLARYYSSTQGRFTSPDEFTGGPDELYDFADDASDNPTFYADLTNPQSLNKYQYTYNNPLNLTDDDGHCPLCPKGDADKQLDALQTVITVIGVIPGVGDAADIVNAGISAVRGNWKDAAADAAGAIPVIGSALPIGNRIRKLVKAADKLDDVVDTANDVRKVDNAADVARAAPKLGSQGGPGAGKGFSKATKDAERAASNNTCRLCGVTTTRSARPSPTRSNTDHAVPKSRNGNNTRANAQNTCQDCNLKKGKKTTKEFLQQD